MKWIIRPWIGCAMVALTTYAVALPLQELIDPIDPETKKWASVVLVDKTTDLPRFDWHHYRDSVSAVDFWPASTIKIYTVVGALELLNELDFPLDSMVSFERRQGADWHLDASRTFKEMISEVFRRSSNEDYTLLLRFTGIDRINTHFLIPERGFPHSALMRDYVTWRPVLYENEEPQRITLYTPHGRTHRFEHEWSGESYAAIRGATVLSKTTGNCTSTRELAECLRRLMYHEVLPANERYHLTQEQVDLIRYGADGLTGLENKLAGPYAWEESCESVFPEARFFHKGGLISSYALDVACIQDESTGKEFILALAAASGDPSTVRQMAEVICSWIRGSEPKSP